MPSGVYFDLATWHLINTVYSPQRVAELRGMRRFYADALQHQRLMTVVDERLGHELAARAEQAKIEVADGGRTLIDLGLVENRLAVELGEAQAVAAIDTDIDAIVAAALQTAAQAGLAPDRISSLFFTGGSTGMRLLAERISAVFPNARVVSGDRFCQRRDRPRTACPATVQRPVGRILSAAATAARLRAGPAGQLIGQRPTDVGQQQGGANQFLDGNRQVLRRLQRLDRQQDVVGVFEIVGVEVAVQQHQRIVERRPGPAHQPGESIERADKTGHPGVDSIDLGRRSIGFVGLVIIPTIAFDIELENPGIEPLAAPDGSFELGMATTDQRLQHRAVETRGQRGAAFDVGHPGQPAAFGDTRRLHQQAAQKTVEHAGIERFQRWRHAVEQRLQLLELGVAERCGDWRRLPRERGAHHNTICVQRNSAIFLPPSSVGP